MFSNRHAKKLFKAVLAEDAGKVRAYLERGTDIEAKDDENFTPLLHAAKNNLTEIALLLIEKGANVHAASVYGDTALHWAAKNDNLRIAKHLTENLADINQINNKGYSPLMICAIFNSIGTAEHLLAAGARTDIVSANDNPVDAMQIARKHNHGAFEHLLVLHSTGDNPQWELTGAESVSRRSRLNAETALTEHFDFAAKMYTSIVAGPGGAPSHSRAGFNTVAKPLLAEARNMLRALSLNNP